MKKIDFMLTAFRDGFQSVYGARVFTQDFLPAVEAARDAGLRYLEAGGGARFQSLYFYCNEDAFDMMDRFRAAAGPDANLQTLARGVNVVGLESQPADIIRLHATLFKKHGMTTIRNFDALNDVHNLIDSARAITDAGLKHQVCVTLMSLPPGCTGAHDADFYEKTLRDILASDLPYDSVCFKDASGTATPAVVHETIRRARKLLPAGTYIHYHTHETAGISVACNLAAINAGADAIDLSLSPCSGGTCQPDVLTMWHALRGSGYDLDIDVEKVRGVADVFKDCMKDYLLPPEATVVDPLIPWCPMPGGALTANTQMLRDHGILDRYPELIRAMGDVVAKGGYGTSVTPVSQFYFQQAFNNVFFGPWQNISESYGQMVLGYFGKTPVPPDPEIVALASSQLNLPPTTRHPIDLNNEDPKKGIAPARAELKKHKLPETDENIFIAATCRDKGIAFLKGEAKVGVRKESPAKAAAPAAAGSAPGSYTVRVGDKDFSVRIEGDTAIVDGRRIPVTVQAAGTEAAPAQAPAAAPVVLEELTAQMPGTVYKLAAKPGETVVAGQTVVILESMKMEVAVRTTGGGVVREIPVHVGDHVVGGQVVARVG